MEGGDNHLHFYTNGFPFGSGEQFIVDEIPLLSKSFDKVTIYVSNKFGAVSPKNYELPSKFDIVRIDFDEYVPIRKVFLKALLLLLSDISVDKLRKNRSVKLFKKHFYYAIELCQRAHVLNRHFKTKGKKLCYTYWFDQWTNILSVYRRYYNRDIKIISRTHGFDVDKRQVSLKDYPLRNTILKHVDKIVSISEFGKSILLADYPKHKSKFDVNCLGVSNFGFSPVVGKESCQVVSCSSLIPLKQVNKIVDLLSGVRLNVHWTHFGDGKEREEIEKKCRERLKDNVSYELKGNVANTEILSFYKERTIDAFIHLSSLEGIPVALMEAGACGVPLFALNTGGVSEIVNDKTGVLLNEFDEQSIDKLEELLTKKAKEIRFRQGVKHFVEQNFNAKKNHKTFIENYLLPCVE